jgi:hypothetical protein
MRFERAKPALISALIALSAFFCSPLYAGEDRSVCLHTSDQALLQMALDDTFASKDAPRIIAALRRSYPQLKTASLPDLKSFLLTRFPNCCSVTHEDPSGAPEWLTTLVFHGALPISVHIRVSQTYAGSDGQLHERWRISNYYSNDICGTLLDYSRGFYEFDDNGKLKP